MFWSFCCCMKSKQELNNTGETVYSNFGELLCIDEYLNKNILLVALKSQNAPISVISGNNNTTKIEQTNHFPKRTRTDTLASTSSTFSINSFYSIKSSVSRDGDFHSVCSADSSKST